MYLLLASSVPKANWRKCFEAGNQYSTNTSYSETSHPLAEEILSKPWEVRADVNTCLTDHVHFCAHLFFFFFNFEKGDIKRVKEHPGFFWALISLTSPPCPLSLTLCPEVSISLSGFFFLLTVAKKLLTKVKCTC